ncbi:hypothetical protein P3342_005466 [Pyrenophora teres f. teres]|nr:hypothetical protein P3342_005466 [Pyrenophora teres f. teres]
MKLTPIFVRGKKRKYLHPVLQLAAARTRTSPQPVEISSTSTPEPKRQRKAKSKSKSKRTEPVMSAMSALDSLPQELLEIIFLYSMNLALPRCSHALGRKLSARTVTMDFTMKAFFHTVDHRTNYRDRLVTSDASLQSEILSCRFFTYDFFLAYVQRAHDAIIKLRGKAWEATGISVPNVSHFDGLWPFKFTKVPYLAFAPGFCIPEKLLHGPWTKDKASLLYVLVSFNGEIDWEGSMAGEVAKTGMQQAIVEENEHAVAALAVLLGITKAITTETLRHAVIHCGCNITILRHLLFNAQILAGEATSTLDFYDPALWAWADLNGHKGETLKDMLKRAEAFDLEFYFDDNAIWSKIVSFPYGGSKFDARTAFSDVVRELLMNLYRNYGRKITRRRAATIGQRVTGDDTDD